MNKRTIILGLLMVLPYIALAQTDTGLVKCGIVDKDGVLASNQCGYAELITLIEDVLNFIIYKLASPIAALMFGYAGYQYIMSEGDMGKAKAARKIFTNVLYGYGIMLAAFLIVKLIFSFLFPDDYSILN